MNLEKILKPNKNILILMIVSLILTIISFIMMVTYANKQDESVSYNGLITRNIDKANKYVNVTIKAIPYFYATKTSGDIVYKYYIGFDEHNYMYLLRLTDITYNDMETKYNLDKDNFSYYLEGYTSNTEDDLKKITITTYNEMVDKKIITEDNFSSYFGNTYFDETKDPNEDMFIISVSIFITCITLFIVSLILYIVKKVKINKVIKEYGKETLENEILNSKTKHYEKLKVFVTCDKVISYNDYLIVKKISDIIWLYNLKRYYNGVLVKISLLCFDKNKHKQELTSSKKEQELLELIEEIVSKNKNIMEGYTKENKKSYKNYIKEH